MPIARFSNKNDVPETTNDTTILVLTNGDKTALDQVMTRWNFLDEASFLRFALAVLTKAENNQITIQVGGSQTPVSPNDNLLRPRT